MKRQNAEFQRLQLALQMEGRKRAMGGAMVDAKTKLDTGTMDEIPDDGGAGLTFDLTPDLPKIR